MAQIIPLRPLFERIAAAEKKFNEVIVFVHHYGGNKRSFRRHIEWVNELGFDAITFDLPLSQVTDVRLRALPFDKQLNFGLRYVWAQKIEQVLGAIADKKIIYSFSSPSSAALSVIAKRHAVDITALVCDGGPFVDIAGGIDNYLREFNLHNLKKYADVRRFYSKAIAWLIGVKKYDVEMAVALAELPQNFAICSIRAAKDPLVTVDMIERFFDLHKDNYALTKIDLPLSGHLTGLKDEPEIYKKLVGDFLVGHATLRLSV